MIKRKKFEPFERVLFRQVVDFNPMAGDDNNTKWECGFYSHYDTTNNIHRLVGEFWACDDDIISFEGNEDLVGTNNEPEPEERLERGDCIVVSSTLSRLEEGCGIVKYFAKVGVDGIYVVSKEDKEFWKYAIPFQQFDPKNLEETKKHILYVKNGKLVKLNNES